MQHARISPHKAKKTSCWWSTCSQNSLKTECRLSSMSPAGVLPSTSLAPYVNEPSLTLPEFGPVSSRGHWRSAEVSSCAWMCLSVSVSVCVSPQGLWDQNFTGWYVLSWHNFTEGIVSRGSRCQSPNTAGQERGRAFYSGDSNKDASGELAYTRCPPRPEHFLKFSQ